MRSLKWLVTCILLSGIAFYKNRREASFFLSLPRMGNAIKLREMLAP